MGARERERVGSEEGEGDRERRWSGGDMKVGSEEGEGTQIYQRAPTLRAFADARADAGRRAAGAAFSCVRRRAGGRGVGVARVCVQDCWGRSREGRREEEI